MLYRIIFTLAYVVMNIFSNEVTELRFVRSIVFIGIFIIIVLLEEILNQLKKQKL